MSCTAMRWTTLSTAAPSRWDQINSTDGSDTVSYAFSHHGACFINLASQATADSIDSDTLSSIETLSAGNSATASWRGRMRTGSRAATETTPSCSSAAVRKRWFVDFNGNKRAPGNSFDFIGFGTLADGASLTQLDGTHWRINSADGSAHEIITLTNGAIIDQSDFVFT